MGPTGTSLKTRQFNPKSAATYKGPTPGYRWPSGLERGLFYDCCSATKNFLRSHLLTSYENKNVYIYTLNVYWKDQHYKNDLFS